MKSKLCLVCLLAVVLTSCNTVLSSEEKDDTLSLTLEIEQSEVRSFSEVKFEARLTNKSDSDVLVHKRLFYLPLPAPPSRIEVILLITDQSGNLVANETISPNYELPSVETLVVLHPGETRKKTIYLDALGFYEDMFKAGEIYTAIVTYQNDLHITETINGAEAHAWVGSIQSNKVTFTILP
ncbi:MAG: hypothetical protein AB1750_14185 [Chloroflexota bacterium]